MASTTLPRLSPSALNRFLGCEYRTYLDIREQRGELDAERRPPNMSLLLERGERYEEDIVTRLQAEGTDVVSLESIKDRQQRAARTVEEMRVGRSVIHQGCFVSDGRIGYPDFLVRIETPSALGAWSYEVHDAKLGSNPEPKHIFQLLHYTDELERLQGLRPERMHLMLGNGDQPNYRPDAFAAYATRVRQQFEARHAELSEPAPAVAYPYPVADCDFCHWWHVCKAKRRDDDHLSLVAGLQRGQGLKLEATGVHTVVDVAALPDDVIVPRLAASTVTTLRAQAGIQVRSRGLDRPLYELLEPEHDRGLARLPRPSAGDVHFDFEGDPYWGEGGLEYLFGSLFEQDGAWTYEARWATNRAEEQTAFEGWVDWITDRLAQHPDLHVFHYNSYEPVALKRLVDRFGTREHEVDELLRREVFVDLYGVVRQALRAGVERYGLKAIEPIYGFQRNAALKGATGSMKRWQSFLEDGAQSHLDEIELYNADDCRSTLALMQWLLDRKGEAERQYGVSIDALAPRDPKEPSDKLARYLERIEEFRTLLLGDLPDDEALDAPQERLRRLTFGLLGYHRREDKPAWWEFFDRRTRSLAQLRDEDTEAVAGLEVIACEIVARSMQWTMRFPVQEFKLGPGGVDDPIAEKGATLVSLDETARTLVVKRGLTADNVPPLALAPGGPYGKDAQVEALFAFGSRVATHGSKPCGRLDAGADLLCRRAPRLLAGTPALDEAPFDLERVKRQVRGLDSSVLVIQGPPGTGKTYTGARLVLDLVGAGKTVGVMATSHKAINNMLAAIDEAADELGLSFRGWKKCTDAEDGHESERFTNSKACPSPEDGPIQIIGATAWHWAAGCATDSVDVLFVDEAGQVSLADAIAASQAASSLVLLGDPQQLPQVSQGSHSLGSGASVLEHYLGDDDTVPADRGIFLQTSWRMHPSVRRFVSETMYEGRLQSVPGCEVQGIHSAGLVGDGLRLITVDHLDNRTRSEEEADFIAEEVTRLLDGGRYVDRDGVSHPLTLGEILVVAPYNAQVRCLKSRLPDGASVGTVDKFQGQEAPVVLFSMAASSGEDVSRGLSFLFSRNRLNVAISRAQALAVIVCSPRLLNAKCSRVQDMELVNMLCRFAESAEVRAT